LKDPHLLANPGFSQLFRRRWASIISGRKVITQAASGTPEDLVFLRELIEAGKIEPVIDRSYTLEKIPEAHRYIETGKKMGNVAITVGSS
jgi:NADPH:quinone reductase-like Zn-dependent oxidoreductase